MKVSIIGAAGYTGAELLRLLGGHPEADIRYITSESSAGKSIAEVYPHLQAVQEAKLVSMEALDEVAADSDALFIALPHGHAMAVGKRLEATNVKIIDLGADYRFKDTAIYEAWYKVPHTHKDAKAVYGLTEWYREDIRGAKIVGNAGCYTTASIMALAPLVKKGLVELDSLVVDAKSGVSGAGRSLSLNSHFGEMYENLKAYNVGGHRHTPEIEQALGGLAKTPIVLSFTPHLIPMSRGILSTCYGRLKAGVDAAAVDAAYEEAYGQEYFVRLLGRGGYPATKAVRGSNFCDLGWHVDMRTRRVVALSAIDNLVKGAAGQAVQNMNVLFNLPEKTGLELSPMYP